MVNRRNRIKEKAISPWHRYQDLFPRWVCSGGATQKKQLDSKMWALRKNQPYFPSLVSLSSNRNTRIALMELNNDLFILISCLQLRFMPGPFEERLNTTGAPYCVLFDRVRSGGTLESMGRVGVFLKHMGCVNNIQPFVPLIWISRVLCLAGFLNCKKYAVNGDNVPITKHIIILIHPLVSLCLAFFAFYMVTQHTF